MSEIVLAMGYAEDGWHSTMRLADGLSQSLRKHFPTLALQVHKPPLQRRPRFLDRRWLYQRTLPSAQVLHLLDQSYGDALLAADGRWRASLAWVADLAFWHDRTIFNSIWRRRILKGLESATMRVAMSKKTAGEMEVVGLKVDAIIYPGVSTASFRDRQSRRIDGRLLHVGSTLPRKGIDRLIRLLAALPEPYHLLQIGGVFTDQQKALIASLKVSQRIAQISFADEQQLLNAYSEAECLVFPSRYEGYGFPVIEARLSGTPVLTTANVPATERLVDDLGTKICDFSCFDSLVREREISTFVTSFPGFSKHSARPLLDPQQYDWTQTAAAFRALYARLVR